MPEELTGEIQQAAFKANEDLGEVKVVVENQGKLEEKSLLSTDRGTSILETYENAQKSIRDGLTGLYNRRYLDKTLAEFKPGQKASVVMIDIDRFKDNYNDKYGHDLGDKLLVSVARTLENNVSIVGNGDTDIVCRYGGEEFAVILVGLTDPEILRRRAEEIRQAVKRSYLKHQGIELHPTVSIGVAIRGEGEAMTETLNRSDQALFQAKRTGRDKVVASS